MRANQKAPWFLKIKRYEQRLSQGLNGIEMKAPSDVLLRAFSQGGMRVALKSGPNSL